MIWLLFAFGVSIIIVGGFALYHDQAGVGFSLFAYGSAFMIFAAVVAVAQSDDDCAQRGGTQVPDGAPYYIKSGDVMVPIQSYRCELP